MTIDEARHSSKVFLDAADVAPILESDPHAVRLSARAGTLGFPVTLIGNRVKIPRLAFLAFLGYREDTKC